MTLAYVRACGGDDAQWRTRWHEVAAVIAARDNVLTATSLSADLKAQIAADSRDATAEARTEWPLHGIAADITDQARAIDVPTLVIAGEHDQVEPTDVLRENLLPYLARAELRIIPRTGHLIPLEAPADLASILHAPKCFIR